MVKNATSRDYRLTRNVNLIKDKVHFFSLVLFKTSFIRAILIVAIFIVSRYNFIASPTEQWLSL